MSPNLGEPVTGIPLCAPVASAADEWVTGYSLECLLLFLLPFFFFFNLTLRISGGLLCAAMAHYNIYYTEE